MIDIQPKINMIKNAPNVAEISGRLTRNDIIRLLRYLILKIEELEDKIR